jgi:succinoglycan biosynthesis transport protein ExoP
VLLDKLTGGTLLVVAADQTRKRHLGEALRTLETAGGTLAGFALNKVSAAEEAYHYKGYYGQQHAKDTERRSRGSRSAPDLPASRAARREQSRTRR